ncbi:MAG: TRAP transporter large permease [candidate division NC10 bacterium]|nr:TRAP transporter large permease [candidate division NC10 bacterium]
MLTLMGVTFLLCLAVGVPIAFCLGITAAVSLLSLGLPLQVVAQRIFTGIDSFPLLAVPFFILAGDLMNQGGTTQRLVRFSNVLVGWIRGGLAHTNIVASMFLAGISGSAVADASAIGGILIPGMTKEGYDVEFSAAVTASASTMGPIIPPSIFMVIYGVTTGVSVGGLFAAGFIPGVLMGLSFMTVAYVISRRRNYPRHPIPSGRQIWEALREATFALLAPVIILGGILTGVFTPTEAAAVAVGYAFLVGLWVHRELHIKELPGLLIQSGITTSVLLLVIGTANVLAWVLSAEQVPQKIAQGLLAFTTNPHLIMLLINLFLLVVGMFMEGGAAIIILAPVLSQVATSVGIHPLHFGFVVVLNIVIGLLTPPLGVCLFVVCSLSRISIERLVVAVMPFLLCEIAILFLVSYVPMVALLVPRLLGYVQ